MNISDDLLDQEAATNSPYRSKELLALRWQRLLTTPIELLYGASLSFLAMLLLMAVLQQTDSQVLRFVLDVGVAAVPFLYKTLTEFFFQKSWAKGHFGWELQSMQEGQAVFFSAVVRRNSLLLLLPLVAGAFNLFLATRTITPHVMEQILSAEIYVLTLPILSLLLNLGSIFLDPYARSWTDKWAAVRYIKK
jgi:hypothetical protein